MSAEQLRLDAAERSRADARRRILAAKAARQIDAIARKAARRTVGVPWFIRLQAARQAAGEAAGNPLREPAELVDRDCERFGIVRESLPVAG